jgi:predicted TIM-barrel fold metal-dependent hydrolase
MKIDMHCHVLGNGKNILNVDNDIYYDIADHPMGSFDARKLLVKNIVTNVILDNISKEGGKITDKEIKADDYFKMMKSLLVNSTEIDAVVLLAMDGIFNTDPSHELMIKETELFVSNKYLYKKICELNNEFQNSNDDRIKKKRFLFGASVSPNRSDWESELEYVCTQTDAVLLKWIPSAMHINVDNQEHRPFYEMLRRYNLPLLCHVGPEYAFIEGVSQESLDNYKFLETPLSYGVKVIAAHCDLPYFPTDKNDLDGFIDFIKKWNNGTEIKLWADTSALTASTRIMFLEKIINNILPEWLLNGSDFPVPISGLEHLPFITHDMTFKEYMDILNTKNPFDLDVKIKRAHGFSDSILENPAKVLRLN